MKSRFISIMNVSSKIKYMNISLLMILLLSTGCTSFNFKQAIGFERAIPREFSTITYTPFTVPPFIADLPKPEYEQLKTKTNKALTANSLSNKNKNIEPKTPDLALLKFLDSSFKTKDAETKFNSYIQGLFYLSVNELTKLKSDNSVQSRGIIISLLK